MSKALATIRNGLRQAIAHQRGKRVRGMRLHVPAKVDVKAVRRRTGLTQLTVSKYAESMRRSFKSVEPSPG
jgi:hypothetical protein